MKKNKPAPKGDTTQARRITKRRKALNEKAGQAGYFHNSKPSWSAYETAVINGLAQIHEAEEK